jgi:hypothetical protein
MYNVKKVDDYTGPIKLHKFSNMDFRTEISPKYSFYTPIGIIDKQLINITNKQLSFLKERYIHNIGDWYYTSLNKTIDGLINSNNKILINEPVFYFFDYEAISGSCHTFDCMFYLLYWYKYWNMNCRLLVVNSPNKYYNTTLKLIKENFNIEFLYIDINTNYQFAEFYCVRNYVNVFFKEVKEFINLNLILPIMKKYEDYPFYEKIIKLKYSNPDNITNPAFERTEELVNFYLKNNIIDLNDIENEEYKIYLINKANDIAISWGSVYYININYYLNKNINNPNIVVLFHKEMMGERYFLQNKDNLIYQNIGHYHGGETDQIYTTFNFFGKIIENLNSNIDNILTEIFI